MIKAVIFDLDDTLCPEIEYVKSGFKAISKEFKDEKLFDLLYSLFKSDRANVYQRAGFSDEEIKKCIEIYRNHKPELTLGKDARDVLLYLKTLGIKLGIITDGRPEGQRNKIEALGLSEYVDCIIVTDELGGVEFRKPNTKAFEIMKEKLSVEFREMIYVGDNPIKDFIAPKKLGMESCYFYTVDGLYTTEDCDIENKITDMKQLKTVIKGI